MTGSATERVRRPHRTRPLNGLFDYRGMKTKKKNFFNYEQTRRSFTRKRPYAHKLAKSAKTRVYRVQKIND